MDFQDFLKAKQDYGASSGFEPLWMPDFLFDFQSYLVDWAIRKGRAAIFADCGMGKTPMQLVWGQNVIQKTNKPVLVLTPLSVSAQTIEEADKFGIVATRAVTDSPPATIQVTNYEKLHHYDAQNYGGVVCDESSILKNFRGKRKGEITDFVRQVPYRLLCTATAAPNDWIELGTSSEALGYLGYRDMLTKFFKRRQVHALHDKGGRKEWQIKGHAAKGPFWQWVASWARAARKPSDLDGFDDTDFTLPPLIEQDTLVKATTPTPGMLFDLPAITFQERREAIRRTIQERCEKVAEIVMDNGSISMVWCNLNDEGNLLEKLIPGSVQVAGRHSDDHKEQAAHWFRHGTDDQRVLISKPRVFGFGLNFQHCNHTTYFPTDSYEQYYQATRRMWRFGQGRPVTVDRIYTDGGERMMQNLRYKTQAASEMFDKLVRFMREELRVENIYQSRNMEVPQWMQ